MIVVDSSAVVAILAKEDDAEAMIAALWSAGARLMSAISYLEVGMVVRGRFGPEAVDDLEELIAAAGIEIVPFDRAQGRRAREAFGQFGRGRHPAGLNLGDCAAYALAATRDLPLLYKGNDFARTDLRSALKV